MRLPADRLATVIRLRSFGFASGDLIDMLASNANRSRDWLAAGGANLADASIEVPGSGTSPEPLDVLLPTGLRHTWIDTIGTGPDLQLELMEARLKAAGGQLLRGREAVQLVTSDGNVAGVATEGEAGRETLEAGAVLLADGGFQANPHFLRRYIAPTPANVVQRNARTGVGIGLALALELGAQLIATDAFYGHLVSTDAMGNDRLWYPILDAIAVASIIVDRRGMRFVDEGTGGVNITNQLAHSSDPEGWVIADSQTWEGPIAKAERPSFPNPALIREGGTVLCGDNIEALAASAGLPSTPLAATVAQFNQAVRSRTLGQLPVSRTDPSGRALQPIQRSPFYAFPVRPGITFTMGGPLTDAGGHVLGEHGSPIGGLYAAGSAASGFEGGPVVGYVGGLARALITGLVTGEQVATDLAVTKPKRHRRNSSPQIARPSS
jgi:fumarate reductase flavoprotein subunit